MRPPGSQTLSWSSSKSSAPRMSLRHAGQWAIALAKRAYPAVLVFAIFATAVVAIIALRLAIWLPIYGIKWPF
jgi:hypothetical protein